MKIKHFVSIFLSAALALIFASTTLLADPARDLANLFVGGPMLAASPEIQVGCVRKAQDALRVLGYFHGPVNGIPDANLTYALKAYQKDSRFKATGRLDKITLQGLDIDPSAYQPGR
jgi:peptidoglycan hydrolase-like protein with peptidoglycan-binding domain